jgi:hypothetical protein
MRLDIDLSAKDGSMDFVKAEGIQAAMSGAAAGADGAARQSQRSATDGRVRRQ